MGDNHLLEETGGIGSVLALGYRIQTVSMQGIIEVYAGEVDYKDLLEPPTEGVVDYSGFRAEMNWAIGGDNALGGLGTVADSTMTPYAGLGLESWERDGTSIQEGGHVQDWLTLYAHIGIDFTKRLTDGSSLYSNASYGHSFFNAETADLSAFGFGDVDLNPGLGPILQARGGWTDGKFFAGIFARQRKFSKSDLDDTGNFFQPKLHQEMAGLEVGLIF